MSDSLEELVDDIVKMGPLVLAVPPTPRKKPSAPCLPIPTSTPQGLLLEWDQTERWVDRRESTTPPEANAAADPLGPARRKKKKKKKTKGYNPRRHLEYDDYVSNVASPPRSPSPPGPPCWPPAPNSAWEWAGPRDGPAPVGSVPVCTHYREEEEARDGSVKEREREGLSEDRREMLQRVRVAAKRRLKGEEEEKNRKMREEREQREKEVKDRKMREKREQREREQRDRKMREEREHREKEEKDRKMREERERREREEKDGKMREERDRRD